MSIRIALSGSAGVGKSTLAKGLAVSLGLPYVQEGMRTRIEGGLRLEDLDPAESAALCDDLWREQALREAECASGFVADRSSLDYFAFWLHYGFHHDEIETQRRLHDWMEASRAYDRIFLLPWGTIPLVDDGVRSTNPWTQLRYQGIVELVLKRFCPPSQVVEIPATGRLDERLAFALESIGATGR